MGERRRVMMATIEDCVSVLLDRGADLLDGVACPMAAGGAISFNLKAWAAVRGIAGRLGRGNSNTATLVSYADFAMSGIMSRPVDGGAGLGRLAHLDRHAARFVLGGGNPVQAREKVVRLFGQRRMPRPVRFDEWLLDEVRGDGATQSPM